MPEIDHLPTREEGEAGLLQLAEVFGKKQVYELILLCRTAQNRATDAAGAAMRTLGLDLVDEAMASGLPFDEARRQVADDLGYTGPTQGNGRSNFYQLLKGGRPDQRRRADYR